MLTPVMVSGKPTVNVPELFDAPKTATVMGPVVAPAVRNHDSDVVPARRRCGHAVEGDRAALLRRSKIRAVNRQ